MILSEKKNCIIEELNKVLVSTDTSSWSQYHQAGMELASPLIFLDSSQLDSSETELEEYLPLVGDDYILPKEQSEDYIDLPILHELGTMDVKLGIRFIILFIIRYNMIL